MSPTDKLFLDALQHSLMNTQVTWSQEISAGEWNALFHTASEHHVLPMIFEAVYACPSARNSDPGLFSVMKRQVMQLVMMQAMKTAEFEGMYQFLSDRGIHPLVVKGIICRELYPQPDYRMSGDEDLLIRPENFEVCHQAMLDYGMQLSDPEMDIRKEPEVPYGKAGSPIYIELHKYLFPPDSEAYGDMNRLFSRVHEQAVDVEIGGVKIRTMDPTDHLFYLICHSFKHFMHGGFGLRQVCDIVLYANEYGGQVAWNEMLADCRKIRADRFAAALFRIGEKILTFDREKACMTEEWRKLVDSVDEQAMLADLLASGVYGGATMSRKHSSTITLDAVKAEKQGRKAGCVNPLKSVCLPLKSMVGNYPYLKKLPWLLPVAWVQRVVRYLKETKQNQADNNAAEAMKIGKERIELMREYGILK